MHESSSRQHHQVYIIFLPLIQVLCCSRLSRFGVFVPYFALSGNYISLCQPRWRERRWWKWWWNGTREEWKGHGPGWKNDSYSDGTLQGMAIPILYKLTSTCMDYLKCCTETKLSALLW